MPKQILIVEDDPAVRDRLRHSLDDPPHLRVTAVTTIRDAI